MTSLRDLLEDHTPAVVDLVMDLRRIVRQAMPEAVERVYPGWDGVGFHHPEAGYVCALFPDADRVRVGFEHGHLLPDPHGVFDQGGRQVRYVTVRAVDAGLAVRLGELIDHAVHLRSV